MFRSRLEARWAAFFDLLRWPWSYEPFYCDGWLPDFVINGVKPVLVEVKPITWFAPEVGARMREATGADRKTDDFPHGTPPSHDLLLVGIQPGAIRFAGKSGTFETHEIKRGLEWCGPVIGWMCDHSWDNIIWDPGIICNVSGSKQLGLVHGSDGFDDRISGIYEGGSWCAGEASDGLVTSLWKAARETIKEIVRVQS